MKKNITINLCGRLFAIDEDAYEMLSTYDQSLRNYFRAREGGEEITDDIEARIAELMDEVKQQGSEAITIEHVREIIHRIGKPDEISPSLDPSPEREGEEAPTDNQQAPLPNRGGAGGEATKRLYRNPADQKLMGVLSGFAAYFGGDVLWWRLGYAAIVLLSFAGSSYNFLWFLPGQHLFFHIYFWGIALIIAYVLLAILMPVAETPEDRLRMKGKEVNPQNLAEEVTRGENAYGALSGEKGEATTESSQQTATKGAYSPSHPKSGCVTSTFGCIGGFFVALWTVISTLFRWCLYACGVSFAGLCIFCIVSLAAVALNPIEWFHKGGTFMESQEFDAIIPSLTVPFYVFVVAALLVLAITAYAIIHSLLNEFKQMPAMPYRQRIALLVMWILGLVAAGAACGYGLPKFIDAENAWYRREREEHDRYRQEHTHNGIYIQPHEWEWLQKNDWQILNAEGCNDRFTTTGQYFTGDRDVRYLDCYDDLHRQHYRAERTETLQPGIYRLTCAARTDGTGACIYAIVGDGKPVFKEIPATGNEGGSIWAEAKRQDGSVDAILQANGGKGYGWNRLIIEPIRITTATTLRYGLTSDDAFTERTWLGKWFSATDFELVRIDS